MNLSGSPQWYGTIIFLRLDPVSNVDSGKVIIDYIRLAADASVVEEKPAPRPSAFRLDQNYPNPFNPLTTIRYYLPKNSQVKINVYNSSGRRVTELVNKRQNTGEYQVVWRADKLASGVYFYRLEASGLILTRKALLLK